MFSLDTNILVYAFQPADRRQPAAVEILRRALGGNCALTLQALGEFFVVVRRRRLLPAETAAQQVDRWLAAFPIAAAPSAAVLRAAIAASVVGRFSYWDALLLATAGAAGCTALISEDMAPGAELAGVRVVPAFAGADISPDALQLLS